VTALVRLIYRSLAALPSWFALSARSSALKNAEILVLRHEVGCCAVVTPGGESAGRTGRCSPRWPCPGRPDPAPAQTRGADQRVPAVFAGLRAQHDRGGNRAAPHSHRQALGASGPCRAQSLGRHSARMAIGCRPIRRREFPARLAKADLDVLKALPEKKIKQAFAKIISESEVPNDWGGEQFDLWSTVISVEGQRLRAAFAFKGPSRFRPMTIASLGKNGDQIDRLAQTAADLVVVQHCHTITAPVANMLKAYASNFRDPKRYMPIDGLGTIRILRYFGYLSLPALRS
jgi:hypothetical protein